MLRRTFLKITASVSAIALPSISAAAADSHVASSVDFIRQLADKAISTLSDPAMSTDARRVAFRQLFTDSFAVRGIGLYVLGRYRKRATKAELDEYLSLFEDVTVNTWADRFTEYAGQKFEVNGGADTPSPSKSEKAALVRSTFFTNPDSPIEIEWRVATNGTVYKVVDVKVSGLSLAKTQQDDFVAVIRSGGNKVSALIEKLRDMRGT